MQHVFGLRLIRFWALVGATTALAIGCSGKKTGNGVVTPSDVSAVLGNPPLVAPSTAETEVGFTVSFSATDGTTPITYAVNSGVGTIDPNSGLYTAGTTAGTATVRATDAIGRTSDAAVTVQDGVQISPTSVDVALNATQPFVVAGGVAPKTFSIVSGGGSIDPNTGMFTAPSSAGGAVVRVTDALGVTSDAAVNAYAGLGISPASLTLAVTNTGTFSSSGGVAPHTYSIVSGGGTIDPSTGAFTAPASAGSVTVRVTDNAGNTADATVTVNPALAISPATKTMVVNQSFAFSASGGVGSYAYSLLTGSGSVNATSGAYTAPSSAGSATIRVTDSYGNTSDASVTILDGVTINPTTKTLAVNDNFTFSSSGGIGARTYSVISGGGSINATTGAFTAPATSATVNVRVTDAEGNYADAVVTVNPGLAIAPSTKTMNVNASFTFTATGGVGAYTYSVALGGGSINSSSGAYTAPSSAGSVTIRVTDADGHTSDAAVSVVDVLAISPSTLTLMVNDGSTFTATGGEAPRTYSVVSGGGSINSTTGVFTAPASAGTVTVRVTDNLGATSDATVTVNPALAIAPATKTMTVSTSFTFSATGGVGAYTYSVISGGGSVNSGTGSYTAPSSAGSATIRVTDAGGHTSDSAVTILAALVISPSTLTLMVGDASTFTATGGEAPRTFSVVSGGGSINSSTGAFTAPLMSGTVVVRVTDNLGSTSDSTVTVNPALAISPSSRTMAVNSSFTFSATGGLGGYTYSVQSGGGSVNSSTGSYTAPASAGSATVRVTDSGGHTSDASVTIFVAPVISPATKTLAVNDVFVFTATGGVAPLTFSILSGGGSINSSTGSYTAPATAGSATVRVTDNAGNTSDSAVTINPALAINPASITLAQNGATTFSATGGVPGYTYSKISGGGSINSSTGAFTAPATSGSTVVRVTDSLSHTSNATITTVAPVTISPNTLTITEGGNQTFTAGGGVPPYDFSMVSGSGSIDAAGSYDAGGPGTDIVQVEDSVGLTAQATITVNGVLAISPTTLTLMVNDTDTFSAVGGIAPYTFSKVSGVGTVNSATGEYTAPATAGSAVIRVTDSVSATSDAAVTVVDSLSISPQDITLAVNRNRTFSAVGGIPPLTFSVVSGGGSINSTTGVYTSPATSSVVTIRVTDSEANTADTTVNVVTPVKIVAGETHTCILFDNGSVRCWGANSTGQLGQGHLNNLGDAAAEMSDALGIVPLGTGRTAVDLFAGGYHNCAILDNATTKCWGYNGYGQLGLGTTNNMGDAANEMGNSLPAINVGTGLTVTTMSLGLYHSCAILSDNTLKCWGRNSNGQLGLGNTNTIGDASGEMGNSLAVVSLGTGFTPAVVSAGDVHTCAISTSGVGKCWGSGQYGKLGVGNTNTLGDGAGEMGNSLAAVNLGTGVTALDVSTQGATHTCWKLSNSTTKCYGRNNRGQLGQGHINSLGDTAGEMGNGTAAIDLGSGVSVDTMMANNYTSCASLDTGSLKCWGYNNAGQLGKGNTNTLGDAAGEMGNSLTAISLGTGKVIDQYTVGASHVCVLFTDKTIKCWGSGANGRLGLGSTTTYGDGAGEMGDSLPLVNY